MLEHCCFPRLPQLRIKDAINTRSPQPGNRQPEHNKPITQHPVHPRPEPRIGDARFAGVAGRVDDSEALADYRGREGRGQGVADLDKAAALVGHQQHRAIERRAAALLELVADDLGGHAAGAVADEQQIAADHQRQAGGREGEADQEEDCFDGGGAIMVLSGC